MKLRDIVNDKAIVTDLAAADRDAVITELVDLLIAAGAISGDSRDAIIEQILVREHRGSTGFGKGVAVPHVKHGAIERMAAAVGVSPSGVEFNSLDKQPVYSIILLLSPDERPEEHLQAMEVIFKTLSKETFRRFLRQATTVEDVITLLDEADVQHFAS